MHCRSPRASSGLIIVLKSSGAPSAAPAPTNVCSSSMKSTMSRALRLTSSRMRLTRPSNSPRYFVPATSGPSDSARTRLPRNAGGALPLAMRWARPSTMAVFPTPGSPTRQGLFLLRRARIEMMRSISRSRPMTGSSLPSRASSVRSREKAASVGVPPRKRFPSSSSGEGLPSPCNFSASRALPAMRPAAARAAPTNGSALVIVRLWAQAMQRRPPWDVTAACAPQDSQTRFIW